MKSWKSLPEAVLGKWKVKIAQWKYKLMVKWAREVGLTPVKILEMGGDFYIKRNDGQIMKIGNGPARTIQAVTAQAQAPIKNRKRHS